MIRARIDVLAAALAVFATLTQVARAEPLRASLVVTRGEGAEDCPDTAGMKARVVAITGTEAFGSDFAEPREIRVQVELVRVLSVYRAVIVAHGRRQGTRSIEDIGPSCSSLADAVAITLVMLLDPELVEEPKAPTATTAPDLPEQTPARKARPAPVAPAPRSTKPTVVRVGGDASLGASIAVLGHAVPLAEAGARLGVGSIATFGAGGGGLLPDRVVAPGGSVDLGLVYGYLRGCADVFSSSRSEISLCVVPLLGSLRGAGRSYDDYQSTRRLLWLAFAGAIELGAPLSPSVGWHARALALAPLIRHGFTVRDASGESEAFATPALGGMLTLGLMVEL